MDERRAARWRQRRIIYNNDGDDVREVENHHDACWQLTTRQGELIDDFLAARTTSLVGTQVDSIWYSTCTGGLWFTHNTKLGGYYGKGIAQELVDTYGRDDLQIQVDFGHQNGLEVFWSLRMNDTHDAYPENYRTRYYGIASFKLDHPEYLMGEPEDWDRYGEGVRRQWTSLDFSYPQVRDHVFSLVEEVCRGYDVDGVELDFFRAPNFFPPTMDGNPVEREHVEMMTDLVRRMKRMTAEVEAERGRPLLLAARTPFAVADARFVGLDLEQWLGEDLIDVLIAGGLHERIMTEPLQEIVELGHRFDVPVYPCVGWPFWNHWAFLDQGGDEHRTYGSWVKTLYGGHPNDMDKQCYITAFNAWQGAAGAWRGGAMNVWNSGADGVYVFNAFHSTPAERWLEIGDPRTLAGRDKIFGLDRFHDGSRLSQARELALEPGEPLGARFQVGEDVSAADVSGLRFRLHLWDYSIVDKIEVALNGEPLTGLEPADPTENPSTGQWLECRLQPDQVVRGENKVEVTVVERDGSKQTPLIVDAVQVHVKGGSAHG